MEDDLPKEEAEARATETLRRLLTTPKRATHPAPSDQAVPKTRNRQARPPSAERKRRGSERAPDRAR
jgi:hypothetical protein